MQDTSSSNDDDDHSASLPVVVGYGTTGNNMPQLKLLAGLGGIAFLIFLFNKNNTKSQLVDIRHIVLSLHLPIIIQIGIFIYLALAWNYLSKALSYISPKALMNILFPQSRPPLVTSSNNNNNTGIDRVAAFKRYIADVESRGGGEPISEFPAATSSSSSWLNSPALSFQGHLQGKVVVLDFWTLGCIHCMHIMPALAALESKHSLEPAFAVVGVHSAKFDAEKDIDTVRNAVSRYNIRHPVFNDVGMSMWRHVGISAWPTLVIISPRGKIIATLVGETQAKDVGDIVTAALEYYRDQGLLINTAPLPISLKEKNNENAAAPTSSPLRFPGKITSSITSNSNNNNKELSLASKELLLFIADSGNNRILIVNMSTGQFIDEIGGNGPGLVDGDYTSAAFNRPQGLAFSASTNTLYVADTENHAVRCIDLTRRTVKIVVGNGKRSDDGDLVGGGAGSEQSLNSPWDLVLLRTTTTTTNSGDVLLVAMSGQHQIWKVDVSTGVACSVSGNGIEANRNGSGGGPMTMKGLGSTTSWAQPSGLSATSDGRLIYVADSESSSIRILDTTDFSSRPCVGGDALFADNLFKFGDQDGEGGGALLQHPLAVLVVGDDIYVADSYNHKLKRITASSGGFAIQTVAGTGRAGYADTASSSSSNTTSTSTAMFNEPSGLCLGPDNSIIIADTNNGVLRQYNSRTDQVSTLALSNIPPPRRVSQDSVSCSDCCYKEG